MQHKPLSTLLLLSTISFASSFLHAAPRADVDIDNDNLIEIYTLEDLDAMRDDLAGASLSGNSAGCASTCNGYELMNDLDFDTNGDEAMNASDEYWNDGEGWIPTGTFSTPFAAIFEGNDHEIRNLYINRPSTDYVGLFGHTYTNATLRNIQLTGELMSVTGKNSVGSLVGLSTYGILKNITVNGDVSGTDNVGGLVGSSRNTGIFNSSTSGNVSGNNSIGGLAGHFDFSSSNYSSASGDVSGTGDYVGGLVGHITGYCNIRKSTASGNVSGVNRVGGLVGSSATTIFDNVYASGAVSGSDYVGGLIGWDADGGLSSVYATGSVSGISNVGGLVGAIQYTALNDSYWDTVTSGKATSAGVEEIGLTTTEMQCPTAPSNTTCKPGTTIYNGWSSAIWNFGTSSDYPVFHPAVDRDGDGLIEIYTLDDLNEMRNALDGSNLRGITFGCPLSGCNGYELMNDLDFDTNESGGIDLEDDYYNGGAGWVPVGDAYSTSFTAIFDGNGYEIRNLYINRSGTDNVGLFGYLNGGAIRNIGITGDLTSVSGNQYVAALVGAQVGGDITYAYTHGVVSGQYAVGGLVGYCSGTIANAHSAASVIGSSSVGGLVGNALAASIEKAYATGPVIGSSSVGGSVGGLVGFTVRGTITNAYATGSVQGNSGVGGLLGGASEDVITNVYSTGAVSGSRFVGGLLGSDDNQTIVASHWDITTSGQATSAGSEIGLTTTEIQCPVAPDNNDDCKSGTLIFDSWDAAVWDFGTSSQYPVLKIGGVVHRDSDNDGIFDIDDKFPNNPAASVDADDDGLPDEWNKGCDAACQNGSGLLLDTIPTDKAPAIVIAATTAMDEGGSQTLDASGSSDADGTIASFEWDLDNDGSFDDATGATVDFMPVDNGSFTLKVKVTDNAGGYNIGSRVITVNNVAPVAEDTEAIVKVKKSVEITLSGSDAGSADTLSYQIVVLPAKGTVTIEGNVVTYTSTGKAGGDSFTYTVTDDDSGVSAEATVTIEVTNDASAWAAWDIYKRQRDRADGNGSMSSISLWLLVLLGLGRRFTRKS